ncbi:hypothetical protein EMCRGX_G011475 [Ephydatia muelleri]
MYHHGIEMDFIHYIDGTGIFHTVEIIVENNWLCKQRAEYLQKQDDILSQENKAKARARYKADPEKKKASVRDSYKADPEKKKASVRDSYKADSEKKN